MEKSRILLFLVGCIGTRLILVALAYWFGKHNIQLLKVMGILALFPGLGILSIYIFGLRKTGPEVFNELIWWNNLRPLHGLLWLLFAVLAITGIWQHAWKVLLLDTLIGLLAFTYKRLL